MRHNVMETLRMYHMIASGDRVLVGFSGGADSAALLHCLAGLREEYGFSLAACHVNHGIRGEEALRDQRFCEEMCRKWGIPLTVCQADVPAWSEKTGTGLEEAARELRYGCLFETALAWAEDLCRVKIATAHTLSDSLETVVFSLARGTGLAGLCGIPPVRRTPGRPDIVRPLIRAAREETEAYCREQGIDYVTDSTNLEEQYTRNRIRRRIIPLLREINPGLEQAAGRMTESLREDRECLEGMAEQFLREHLTPGDALPASIPRALWRELSPAVAVRVLGEMMSRHGIGYDQKRLTLCRGAAQNGRGAVQLQREFFLRADSDRIWLERRQSPLPYFEFPIEPDTKVQAAGKTYFFRLLDYEQTEKFKKNCRDGLKNCLDYDTIYGIVKLRQKRDGDRYIPWKRRESHSLKKLFQEKKIPPLERRALAVLEDGQGILWAEGIGCSQRAAPSPSSRRLLIIDISERDAATD